MSTEPQFTLEEFEAEVKGLFPDVPFKFSQRSNFGPGPMYLAEWQHTTITRRPNRSISKRYSMSAEGQVSEHGDTLGEAAANAADSLFYSVIKAKPLRLERFLSADINGELGAASLSGA